MHSFRQACIHGFQLLTFHNITTIIKCHLASEIKNRHISEKNNITRKLLIDTVRARGVMFVSILDLGLYWLETKLEEFMDWKDLHGHRCFPAMNTEQRG